MERTTRKMDGDEVFTTILWNSGNPAFGWATNEESGVRRFGITSSRVRKDERSYWPILGEGEYSWSDGQCDYETKGTGRRCTRAARYLSVFDDGNVCCGNHHNHEVNQHHRQH